MTLYNWIVVACWFVFVVYWALSSFNTKRTASGRYSALSGTLLRIAGAIVVLLILRAGYISGLNAPALSAAAHPVAGTLGAACAVIGIAFAVWARTHLGRNWGMPRAVKENPELITSGPYRYVRHPIYTGVLLALLGSMLVAGPWWLVVFAIACAYFFYSAKQEEKRMRAAFPDAYPAYMRRTKMLIPFVL